MRDLGKTIIVVKHEENTMRADDYLIDIGPGAGENGGKVIAQGTPKEVEKNKDSITGQYLSGKQKIKIPKKRRTEDKGKIKLTGAAENKLKNIDVELPQGKFNVVSGVSGYGLTG